MERSWVWVPVQVLQSGCCRGQLVPPGAALQRPNPLPEPQSSVTGRGLARRFQERKEGWVGWGGLSRRVRWQRNETSSHQVWACHLFLNAGRWWAWRWRRPRSLPRCASVMDAASGSAAEEAEAHLLEPITGGGQARLGC